jgi:hypothetical protein
MYRDTIESLMSTDRTAQLVYELDAFYRSHTMRQKDLAAELGLSAQALSEILSLRNRPNSETVLRVIEFLEKENMPTTTRPVPKTLAEARDQLRDLDQQQKSLEERLAEHKRLGHVPKIDLNQKNDGWQSPGPTPTPAVPLPVSVPKLQAKVLPDAANTPFLLGEYLKVTSREDLVRLLESTKDWRVQAVYDELKKRP